MHLRAGLTEAQLVFEMALQYCLLAHAELCEKLVAELPLGDAQRIGTLGLAQYFAAAVTMPYSQFLETAERLLVTSSSLMTRETSSPASIT